MKTTANPNVKTRKSGVRYVEADDVLRSENGRYQLRKAAEHSASIRRNREKTQPNRRAA
jgi:hypothetical protein